MSITTWTRLEPDTRTGLPALDLGEGVSARLADPLWLLGRQWQVGELGGEDAASPVSARIAWTSFPIDSLRTPDGHAVPFAAASVAVEAEVEHDRGEPDHRTRASGGVAFLERLEEGGLQSYARAVLAAYPLTGATPDGDLLLADLQAGRLRAALTVTAADAAAFDSAAGLWAGWYEARSRRGVNPAWVADRLEYRFSLGATVTEGRVMLEAPEHVGDRLDWDAFSMTDPSPASGVAGRETANSRRATVDAVPALLHMPGMPALGFWEIEDPEFDPGRIEAGPTDTARLLLAEASLAYASDWFLMPLRLPVASLNRIDSLLITDTFGVTTVVRAAAEVDPHPGWGLWRVSGLPYLLLPPPNAGFQTTEPSEQLLFVRDEAANLAWALRTLPLATPPVGGEPRPGLGDLVYIPLTASPDDRVPMVLIETPEGRWLVRGRLEGQVERGTDGLAGVLLAPGMRVRDEELPDGGLTLDRRYELGRTPDGNLHLWVSRAKRPGARKGSGGLVFDRIV